MKHLLNFIFVISLFYSCNSEDKTVEQSDLQNTSTTLKLNIQQANRLAKLPLNCIQTEYPNKLGQVLASKENLGEPSQLHPAFYGCFDWHSSVHGHWSLVKLLKDFPEMEYAQIAREKLRMNLSKENILAEVAYFKQKQNTTYERTYGWAWELKLAEELHTWNDSLARELELNLMPLTLLIAQKFIDFLPSLHYPIRVGEHPNTAFGLSFAWDYALEMKDTVLLNAIDSTAHRFYALDANCPLSWEPSGSDFLSPCFEEIDIMRRVLTPTNFKEWLNAFAPQLKDKKFTLKPGVVSDRTDGKLVHLDGLNFSRAWVLYGLAKQYPEYHHLVSVANSHIEYSLPSLFGDSYEGGHWLGTFAIYALSTR